MYTRPNYAAIDIDKQGFTTTPTVQSMPSIEDEAWLTPEQIHVKKVYTHEDIKDLEHLDFVSALIVLCILSAPGLSDNTPDSLRQKSPMLSTDATLLRGKKGSPLPLTSQLTVDTMQTTPE